MALDPLVCDGKTLKGSAVGTEDGHHRFVAQVTVYARVERADGAPGAAEDDGLGGNADPGGCPAHDTGVFHWCLQRGADVGLLVKTDHPKLHRQISGSFEGKRQGEIPAVTVRTPTATPTGSVHRCWLS
jgi:hypothetical protein